MAAPKWAVDLLARVVEDYGQEPIDLSWRRSKAHRTSSGLAGGRGPRTIHVTAGTERRDQRLVLLHEIAHILTPKEHHGPEFWRVAWELFDRYAPNIPRRYILEREGDYRVEALNVAIERGVRGAKTAARKRPERVHRHRYGPHVPTPGIPGRTVRSCKCGASWTYYART